MVHIGKGKRQPEATYIPLSVVVNASRDCERSQSLVSLGFSQRWTSVSAPSFRWHAYDTLTRSPFQNEKTNSDVLRISARRKRIRNYFYLPIGRKSLVEEEN